MAGLFPCAAFQGFGPTALEPTPEVGWHLVEGPKRSVLRKGIRQCCPKCPGVYGMIGADNDLIYVGKAKSLRTRLLSYFRPRGRDPKACRILGRTTAIAWEHAPSEFAALLRELELIRRWRPWFNVQGRPGRWIRMYVCLGRKPAPYIFLSRRPRAGLLGCFGPVSGGNRLRNAVRWLNDLFQLRDCPKDVPLVFADQVELFPVIRSAGCLRYEIGTCLGPCVAVCSQQAYTAKVRLAHAFLTGKSQDVLARLEREMLGAAQAQAFERAAALRDKWETLAWLQKHLQRMRAVQERLSFIYSVPGEGGKNRWYLIRQGRVASVLPAPQNAEARGLAAQAIEREYRSKKPRDALPGPEAIDQVLLVAGWFHRHPKELARTMKPEKLLARCHQESTAA